MKRVLIYYRPPSWAPIIPEPLSAEEKLRRLLLQAHRRPPTRPPRRGLRG